LAFPLAVATVALAVAFSAAPSSAQQASPLSEPSDAVTMEPVETLGTTPADPVAQAEEVDLPEQEEASEDDFYRIRVGDTLTVSVLEDPNLTRTVFVRPDGRISLPIAGSVKVEGVTPENLETILAERYSRGFQITPTVTVSIRGIAPIRGEAAQGPAPTTFFMLGSVARRGPIAITETVTILEALAIAGGPTPFAATDRIQIRRFDEDGVEQILLFDYERIEDGMPVENNIEIVEGDVIYVPERGLFD
jgi:polysaccharide export outer membrane protein